MKDTLKSVFSELSPILAGFKLAVIVIGYLGLGSFAKWIITYWYPFTRWVWDLVANLFALPVFPIVVKDSLTALVFFLPLGLTAVFERTTQTSDSTDSHRVLGTVFGVLFLLIICKDVLTAIGNYVISSMGTFNNLIAKIIAPFESDLFVWITLLYCGLSVLLAILLQIARLKLREGGTSRLAMIVRAVDTTTNLIRKNRATVFSIFLIVNTSLFVLVTMVAIFTNSTASSYPIVLALFILLIIVLLLGLAILYSPRKLYVTTGASIAFVLASAIFEVFLAVKGFMEGVG